MNCEIATAFVGNQAESVVIDPNLTPMSFRKFSLIGTPPEMLDVVAVLLMGATSALCTEHSPLSDSETLEVLNLYRKFIEIFDAASKRKNTARPEIFKQ